MTKSTSPMSMPTSSVMVATPNGLGNHCGIVLLPLLVSGL